MVTFSWEVGVAAAVTSKRSAIAGVRARVGSTMTTGVVESDYSVFSIQYFDLKCVYRYRETLGDKH